MISFSSEAAYQSGSSRPIPAWPNTTTDCGTGTRTTTVSPTACGEVSGAAATVPASGSPPNTVSSRPARVAASMSPTAETTSPSRAKVASTNPSRSSAVTAATLSRVPSPDRP